MPTLSGMRRRGYTPEAIRDFCVRAGITKRPNTVEIALLQHCVRVDLNMRAPRVMGVLDPLKVVIENYPEDVVEHLDAVNNPEDAGMGTRKIPFSRELYVERDDFMENPPRRFYRLGPSREVRLRYGYFITCVDVVKDATGRVVELRCTYDPETRSGQAARRETGQGHHPLGIGAPLDTRRGAPLRLPLRGGGAGRLRGRHPSGPQPPLTGDPHRLPRRTQPCRSGSRSSLPVSRGRATSAPTPRTRSRARRSST